MQHLKMEFNLQWLASDQGYKLIKIEGTNFQGRVAKVEGKGKVDKPPNWRYFLGQSILGGACVAKFKRVPIPPLE